MFVHFRKRFPGEVLSRINEAIVAKAAEGSTKQDKDDEGDPGEPKASNKGSLLEPSSAIQMMAYHKS